MNIKENKQVKFKLIKIFGEKIIKLLKILVKLNLEK